MQAVKVFNNNAVSVIMPDGREAILVGNGLGFGRRPGDVIDKSRVSKVYYVQNELQTKFLKMLDNVTPQVMQAAERISLAAEEQGILLSSKSTISLVDHISFALERVEKGTFLPNLMLSEIRMLYPKEYAVGQRALELVRQFCGVQLPEDEAGYIALHLVAGAADGALAYDTVKFVMAVKEIICDTYHCTFEEESLETIRLTVHLKFLAARILRHTPWQDAGLESMYTVLLQRDSRNEVCLQRINAYLRQEFDYELDHQEQVYLLIHLTKIVRDRPIKRFNRASGSPAE